MSEQKKSIDPLIYEVWDGPSRESEEKFCFMGKTLYVPVDKYATEKQRELEWEAVKDLVKEVLRRGFIPLNREKKMEKYETFDVNRMALSSCIVCLVDP